MQHGKILLVTAALAAFLALPVSADITLVPMGTYSSGIFDESAAEIVDHDPATQRLFITNADAQGIDVLDMSDPANPTLAFTIDVTPYGDSPTSVSVSAGTIVVAVVNDPETDPGKAVFFDTDGNFLNAIEVGVFPDKITYTPDGNKVLVANEGQPNDDYDIDPEGSVSIIDVSAGVASATVVTADFTAFNDLEEDLLAAGVRIFGPGATVAQDLEPEYIGVSADSSTAWVTLQENNALGVIDIAAGEITDIIALGYKNHRAKKNSLDASNKDDAINIRNWPVLGMYQPDAIAAYQFEGMTYIVTANEGDGRDYDGFSEEARVKDLGEPGSGEEFVIGQGLLKRFPDLQKSANLGRLKITTEPPSGREVLEDGSVAINELYCYGARSFSIWAADGELVYDSGDEFEQLTATCPQFNSTNDDNDSCDSRSDDKGPEPEGVELGQVGGKTYAFIALERTGGIMIYDITDPGQVAFVDYVNNRNYDEEAGPGTGGDLAPEGLVFIKAADSPIDAPLLVVANEVSGTTTIFEVVSNE